MEPEGGAARGAASESEARAKEEITPWGSSGEAHARSFELIHLTLRPPQPSTARRLQHNTHKVPATTVGALAASRSPQNGTGSPRALSSAEPRRHLSLGSVSSPPHHMAFPMHLPPKSRPLIFLP